MNRWLLFIIAVLFVFFDLVSVFGLWGMANGIGVNKNGCYSLPYGLGGLTSAYRGKCPFDYIPIYYAADILMWFNVFSMLLVLVSVLTRMKT